MDLICLQPKKNDREIKVQISKKIIGDAWEKRGIFYSLNWGRDQ